MPEVVNFSKRASPEEFCETPSALAMLSAIDFAVEVRCLAVIVGDPGVGKTTTLKRYAKDDRRAVYICMDPSHSSMAAMLATLSRALDKYPGRGSADMVRGILYALEYDSKTVLLIDEAQHLGPRNVDMARSIFDASGVPVVFAGNASLRNRFDNSQIAAFTQVTSRVGRKVDLPGATLADVAALAGHFEIRQPDLIDQLARLRASHSGLRKIARVLKLAHKLAGEGDITKDHLAESTAVLEGGR